ncbi:hypothetical protein CEXT_83941 [Caerostris extrusa]|uniref:Secreted protein n=1 Tax=Caerostris extrusa TaxID=172846 RepID=A0AAV4QXK1_CAEEX|nr:hypothetical protein CEXT_83941 [Caerostris extrusa]
MEGLTSLILATAFSWAAGVGSHGVNHNLAQRARKCGTKSSRNISEENLVPKRRFQVPEHLTSSKSEQLSNFRTLTRPKKRASVRALSPGAG